MSHRDRESRHEYSDLPFSARSLASLGMTGCGHTWWQRRIRPSRLQVHWGQTARLPVFSRGCRAKHWRASRLAPVPHDAKKNGHTRMTQLVVPAVRAACGGFGGRRAVRFGTNVFGLFEVAEVGEAFGEETLLGVGEDFGVVGGGLDFDGGFGLGAQGGVEEGGDDIALHVVGDTQA